jgi:ribosomal protein S19
LRGQLERIYNRNSSIPKSYLGKEVEVYSGKKFMAIEVLKKMIGHKFGEYVVTTRMGSFIHKKKKRKNKGKKK